MIEKYQGANAQTAWDAPQDLGLTDVSEMKELPGGAWTRHQFKKATTQGGLCVMLYRQVFRAEGSEVVNGYGAGEWETSPAAHKALFDAEVLTQKDDAHV
ncbi:hypothetical protein ACOI1H_19210 [Loktanella sp. DJP18]|uniref:hypothetical protein n=1 Tax=Loktanella sp. DJP18 TaxID=3409788 RepID=UPI003BB77E23